MCLKKIKMWPFIARKILRNRIAFIVVLAMLTTFMGYHASKIELSYEFAKILPSTDSAYTEYNNFKDLFLVREDQNRITYDLSIVLPKAC